MTEYTNWYEKMTMELDSEEPEEDIKDTLRLYSGVSSTSYTAGTELSSGTYTNSFTVPQETTKAFINHVYGQAIDAEKEDLPGMPGGLHECQNCGEGVPTGHEESIERKGEWYCDVDCLNEEVNDA